MHEPQDHPGVIEYEMALMLRLLAWKIVADMQQVVNRVKASDRDWTIVRVPRSTDETASGKRVRGYAGDIERYLSCPDMSAFILKPVK